MGQSIGGSVVKRGEAIGGRYEVVSKLGEGGCGVVFRCRDSRKGGQDAAVKVLTNLEDIKRFRREAGLMRSAKSPHVVGWLGQGVHDGHLPYLALEYMDGGNLKVYLEKRGGRLELEEAAWILVQAVRGLRSVRMVHRDLKPENLLIRRAGQKRGTSFLPGNIQEGAVVKVADFGLAKSWDGESMSLTHSNQIMGTPLYMSPEQFRSTKRVTVATDIYALGVLFYEMLAGRPPFDGDNVYDLRDQHCTEAPNLSRLPPVARPLCERCLRKEPHQRYASLYALERDLLPLAGLKQAKPAPRRWLGWVVLALAAAAAVGAGWYFRDTIQDAASRLWERAADQRPKGGRP